MKWTTLVSAVSARSELPPERVEAVMSGAVAVIAEALLRSDEPVTLRGLGRLRRTWRGPRLLRAVHDGRRIAIDGRHGVRFRAASGLRETLAGRTPQLWRDPRHRQARELASTLVSDLVQYHPDRVPHDLAWDMAPAMVRSRCAAALGPLWVQVARVYEDGVPRAVRAQEDHLALAAQAAWSPR